MAVEFSLGTITLDALPATALASESGGSVNQVYSVDLDADGASDLLVFGGTSGTGLVQPGFVAFGDGFGRFEPAAPSRFPALASAHVREVAFADFNADGRLDVFVADHGWDVPPYAGAQNRLYLSSGDGTWRDASATLVQQADFTHSVATGDLDGDGDVDILVNNSALPSYVYVLTNDGAGLFTPRLDFLPTGPGQLLDPTVRNSLSAAVADLDHDGWADIVLGAGTSSGPKVPMQVLWGEAGGFASPDVSTMPLPAVFGQDPQSLLTYDIQSMDVNFDGLADLVVTWVASVEAGGYELQVLINDGERGFVDRTPDFIPEPSVRASTGLHWIQFLVPADMNGDGRTDFLVDARGGPKPAGFPVALIHQADGTFASFSQSDTPWSLSGPFWAWWPQGTGLFQIDRPQEGTVGGDMFEIAFAAQGPHWVGGTAAGDELMGTQLADELAGFAGNDAVLGGDGIDLARYRGVRADATIVPGNPAWSVTAPQDGTDTLIAVERLGFDDGNIALDLGGAAGQVARVLGTLFGPDAVHNESWVGIGLQLLDGGMGYPQLVAFGLSLFGERSHEDFVNSIHAHVTGAAPGPDALALFTGWLESGTYTQASLALLACDTAFIAQRIGLAQLFETGLAYQPA